MLGGDTVRRLKIYPPRIARMAARRSLKSLCWYMHIPKSGGSSVHEALRSVIPINQHTSVINAVPTRRVAAMVYAGVDDEHMIHEDGPRCAELFKMRELHQMTCMAQEDALIYGHCVFSETADKFFGQHYKYVTMLRDPIPRVISNYRSVTYENYFTGSFDEYLESDVGRRHAQLNLRYFSGRPEIEQGQEDTAMEQAKLNQDKFSVIGHLDDTKNFIDQFSDAFGARPNIPHYNPAKGNQVKLTSNQKNKLEDLCQFDLQLHERAKNSLGG